MELMKMPPRLLCFLMMGCLARTEPQCSDGVLSKDGTCEIHELGSPNAATKPMDDESTDMRVELLQRDLRLSSPQKLENAKSQAVKVKPWKCSGSTAYQSTTANDNSWTKIKLLNLATGGYDVTKELNLDLDKFSNVGDCQKAGNKCRIRSMNACAMHVEGLWKPGGGGSGKEYTLYCALQIYDRGCFLVALDQEGTIGFVHKLEGFRYAAAFVENDYYVSGEKGFSIVKNAPLLPKYESWEGLSGTNEAQLLPLKIQGKTNASKYFGLGADFVVWNKDTLGKGADAAPVNQFLLTLRDHELYLIQLIKDGELVTESPREVIVLAAQSANPTIDKFTGPGKKRCWGAGWNFNGAIYFAADDGSGLWSFDSKSVDFTAKTSKWTKKIPINHIDWNDGFTCGTTLNPPSIKKITCEHDFYQVATFVGKGQPWTHQPEVKKTSETFIRHLDLTTGKFKTDIKVDRSKFPQMTSLNACAVHPNEGVLYCFMEEENRDPQSIISLDEDSQIVLVTEHKKGPKNGKNLCFAAVFDKDANFWYWCADKTLYKASGLEKKKGVWSHDDLGFQDDEGITAYPTHYTDDKVGADFVLWEEKEDKKTYLVSIVKSVDSKVSVIDISDPNDPKEPMIFESSGLEATKSGKEITWGSAWTAPDDGKHAGDYAGKHFFTPDTSEKQEHNKLYQLTDLDFEAKKAHFKDAGEADKATWHDGFTCLKKSIKGVDDGKTIKVG
jgi:hypothetical protein